MVKFPSLFGIMLLACSAFADEGALQKVVVKPGDTLWSIAHRYLKDPSSWDEILKHNKLPSSDPTVALPGMTLLVPTSLIKKDLRAATLTVSGDNILYKRKNSTEWVKPKGLKEVFEGDSLRTLDESKVRVKFTAGKASLDLEPNSLIVVRPTQQEDVDLKSGSVFAGKARVLTANGRVTPRSDETRFTTTVGPDGSTQVKVLKGAVAVDSQGKIVDVPAGMSVRVPPGMAPENALPLEESLASLESQARELESALGSSAPGSRPRAAAAERRDSGSLKGDLDALAVGQAISGYRVQAAADKSFAKVLFDRKYDAGERFSPADAALPPGSYWFRVAPIDLLGAQGAYGAVRPYSAK